MRLKIPALFVAAVLAAVGVISIHGCMGGGGSGSVVGYKTNATVHGYVFVPEGSGGAGKRGTVRPRVVQAPLGMEPLVGATVKLDDGSTTTTDNNGHYEFKLKVAAVEGMTTVVEVWLDETGTKKINYEVKAEIDKYTVSTATLEDLDGDGDLDVKEVIAIPPTEVKPGTGGQDDPEEIIPVITAATFEFTGLQEAEDLETGGEVELTWTAPTLPAALADDVPLRYYLYSADESGGQNYTGNPLVIISGAETVQISNLDNDTYYFVLQAMTASGRTEAIGNTVEQSVTITDQTAPAWADGTGVQAVTMGDEQATVYWNAAEDNTGLVSYTVYYHTGSPATGGTAVPVASPATATGYDYQHTVTGLSNGTTYYFAIHAVDGADPANEDDNTVELTGDPVGIAGAPENVTAVLGYQKIIVSWNPPTDTGGTAVTGYIVYRGLSAGSTSLIGSGVTATTYDDEEDDDFPLEVDTTYYYQVSAVNSVGEGPKSEAVPETFLHVPPTPDNLTASVLTTDSFTFGWDDVAGESGYRVYMDSEQYGDDLAADTISVAVTGLTSGSAYLMEVSSFNAAGEGNPASQIVESLPEAPVNILVTAIESTGFSVSWDALSGDGVDGYRLYLDDEQHGSDITGGITTGVTGVDSGTTFAVRVSAFTGGGANEIGGEGEKSSPAVDALTKPAAPTGLAADSVETDSFTLNWDEVDGEVDGYLVYLDDVQYGTGTSLTTMDITGLDPGTSCSLEVSAYNDTGEGDASMFLTVETVPEAPAIVTAGNITATSFAVSWESVSAETVDGYRVYVEGEQYGGDITGGTAQTVTERTGGTTYEVEVSAFTTGGEGEKSTPIDVLTLPEAPTELTAGSIESDGFTLSWDEVDGQVDGYRVYLDSEVDGDTGGATLDITDLDSGTSYSLEVSAYNDTGEGDASTALAVATLPDAPENVTVDDITTDSFTVSWDAVSGDTVNGYRVYLDDVQYGSDVTSGISVSVTGLTSGAPYAVKISAFNDSGEGPKSASTSVLTLPLAPTGVAAGDILPGPEGGFTIEWSQVTGAAGYRIYLDSSQYDNDITPGTTTTVDVTGLDAGSYPMTVSAYNSSGEGVQSSPAVQVTVPAKASLSGTVTPEGSTVQLWQNDSKVADDENGTTGSYQFTTNTGTDVDLVEGAYTLRAFKRDTATSGYYYEQEIVLSAGVNSSELTATEVDLTAMNITVTSESCTFYGNATLDGLPIRIGDIVTARDPGGVMCGLFIAGTEGEYGLITVYGDESDTPQDEGAEDGDTITFSINDTAAIPSATPAFSDGAPSQNVDLIATPD